MDDIIIDRMDKGFWNDVSRIYREGIATGNATFENKVPDWESWDKAHLKECRLIARFGYKVVGWVALSPVSERKVYSGVAEVSIYVDDHFQREGVGDMLMEALIKESEAAGIWTLQAGIFPENIGSIKLHQKHGFRPVGARKNIGWMDDRWRDVILMERRSNVVGTE